VSAKKKLSENFSAKYYMVIALFSGLGFSFHNLFFTDAIIRGAEQDLFFSLMNAYFLGEAAVCIPILIFRMINSYATTGHFWTKKHSAYFIEVPNSGTSDQRARQNRDHDASMDSTQYRNDHNDATAEYKLKWVNIIGVTWRAALI
jgi:hypothetical protein